MASRSSALQSAAQVRPGPSFSELQIEVRRCSQASTVNRRTEFPIDALLLGRPTVIQPTSQAHVPSQQICPTLSARAAMGFTDTRRIRSPEESEYRARLVELA
jgi:hypothetical protein